jgi:DNA-binding FadR family transcriptional regulator
MKTARLYKTVADDLLKFIIAGDYKTGERLPAERELAVKYNVSRPTMREAIIALEIANRVEVRKGSGVYVLPHTTAKSPLSPGNNLDLDVGPFELTEARMLIEGEAAFLAASLITDEEIQALDGIIKRMEAENEENESHETADKDFHMTIARATRNSALVAIIEELWNLREKSVLAQNMYKTIRLEGVKPSIDEHVEIFLALKSNDPKAARMAMRNHLSRVIDTLLEATEINAVKEAKQRTSAKRERYLMANKI